MNKITLSMLQAAMEWGYKAAERGLNIQAAQFEFTKSMPEPDAEPDKPLWRSERYTDKDRKTMMMVMQEEIRDGAYIWAERELDSYTDQMELDTDYLVDMDTLQHIHMLELDDEDERKPLVVQDVTENQREVEKLIRLGYVKVTGNSPTDLSVTDDGLKALERYF